MTSSQFINILWAFLPLIELKKTFSVADVVTTDIYESCYTVLYRCPCVSVLNKQISSSQASYSLTLKVAETDRWSSSQNFLPYFAFEI